WLGGRHTISDEIFGIDRKPWVGSVISLAGVADLRSAWSLQLGSGAVERLIGGSPEQYPERYSEASPIELLPMSTKQVLIHGVNDRIVSISQSESFVEKAKLLGDRPSLIRLERVGHFEVIDPESGAWDAVAGAVREALKAN